MAFRMKNSLCSVEEECRNLTQYVVKIIQYLCFDMCNLGDISKGEMKPYFFKEKGL